MICGACVAMFVLRASDKMGKNGKSYYTHSLCANTYGISDERISSSLHLTFYLYFYLSLSPVFFRVAFFRIFFLAIPSNALFVCIVYLRVFSIRRFHMSFPQPYTLVLKNSFSFFSSLALFIHSSIHSNLLPIFLFFFDHCQTKTYSGDFLAALRYLLFLLNSLEPE